MNSSFDARTHNHATDLLEDYILGTLSAEDQAWMDWHLQTCPSCQEELAPLMRAMQALPFAAPEPGVQMSDGVWDRIERNISGRRAAEDEFSFVPLSTDSNTRSLSKTSSPPVRMTARQWLAVAALMVLSLVGGVLLAQVLPRFNEDEIQSQQIAIQFTDPNITATGELRYLPDQQVFVLSVNGMPAAPEGHVYQAWLIKGETPIPAGVMKSDEGEIASAGNRNAFDAFAITVEPGPLGNEAPTTEPILVAPLHNGTDKG